MMAFQSVTASALERTLVDKTKTAIAAITRFRLADFIFIPFHKTQ
jgi:hypothetical protein